MNNKAFFLVLLVIVDLMMKPLAFPEYNAYDNDINKCLLTSWTKDTNNRKAVLSKESENCADKNQFQLCYDLWGGEAETASFISCYNNATRIPDFTANKVTSRRGSGSPKEIDWKNLGGVWHNEKGDFAPEPASSVRKPDNYFRNNQDDLYPNYEPDSPTDQYLNKGHCVPCADMVTDYEAREYKKERRLSYINTNAAPQWQPFNSGNWNGLEQAIRAYVDDKDGKEVYVFTGTYGEAVTPDDEKDEIKLHDIVVPMYFWKAVCVPAVGSYVFWAENNVGMDKDSGDYEDGCHGKSQETSLGVIQCTSYDKAVKDSPTKEFKLPSFHEENCKTSEEADFMKDFLNNKLA